MMRINLRTNYNHEPQQSKQLFVGMKVTANAGRELKVPGTVRFIGSTYFASGIWVGVELTAPLGKNNGSVQGHSYFECPMQYGLFLREENVQPISDEKAVSPVSAAGTISSANKKPSSASILKVKLSQMMELLNKQLEIVEDLEQEEKSSSTTIPRASMKCNMLRDEVFKISCREMELVMLHLLH